MSDENFKEAKKAVHEQEIIAELGEAMGLPRMIELNEEGKRKFRNVSLKDFLNDKNADRSVRDYIEKHLSDSEINTLSGQGKSVADAVDFTNRKIEDTLINQKLTAEHEARLEAMAKPRSDSPEKPM